MALGHILLELLVLDTRDVQVVERFARRVARGAVHVVIVRVVQHEVGAGRAANVNEQDIEDDAQMDRDVRGASLTPVEQRWRPRTHTGAQATR